MAKNPLPPAFSRAIAAAQSGDCRRAAVLLQKANRLPDSNPAKDVKAAGAFIAQHCAPGFGKPRAKRKKP